jgi:hypothetical protein
MVWQTLYKFYDATQGRWIDVGKEVEVSQGAEGLRRAAAGRDVEDEGSEDQQRASPESEA